MSATLAILNFVGIVFGALCVIAAKAAGLFQAQTSFSAPVIGAGYFLLGYLFAIALICLIATRSGRQ
jgi:hypothetical protein